MPQVSFASKRVDHEELRRFCRELLLASRFSADQAGQIADGLVDTSLRGTDSHGVARLPHYLRRVGTGTINPQASPRAERLSPSTAIIHGDDGHGIVVMNRATDLAIDLAKETGAGWVTMRDSTHAGAMAIYGLRLARAGFIGFAFTHVDSLVFPFGSRQAFCGTNPICVTAPGTNGQILCLDMATSVGPWNAVANAAMEGVDLPPSWARDGEGQATCDPTRAVGLEPFGSYKGSGLGLIIDMLCALLSNSPFGPDISDMYKQLDKKRHLGGLIGAIKIEAFLPLEQFQARLSEMLTRWGQLSPQPGSEKVLYPGEPEEREEARRRAEGVPVGLQLATEFGELAESLGVKPLGFS